MSSPTRYQVNLRSGHVGRLLYAHAYMLVCDWWFGRRGPVYQLGVSVGDCADWVGPLRAEGVP